MTPIQSAPGTRRLTPVARGLVVLGLMVLLAGLVPLPASLPPPFLMSATALALLLASLTATRPRRSPRPLRPPLPEVSTSLSFRGPPA